MRDILQSRSLRSNVAHKLLVRTSLIIIEIHPVDGFLGGKIRFQISRSIGKSGFRFSKSKSGFLNRMHP